VAAEAGLCLCPSEAHGEALLSDVWLVSLGPLLCSISVCPRGSPLLGELSVSRIFLAQTRECWLQTAPAAPASVPPPSGHVGMAGVCRLGSPSTAARWGRGAGSLPSPCLPCCLWGESFPAGPPAGGFSGCRRRAMGLETGLAGAGCSAGCRQCRSWALAPLVCPLLSARH